MTEARDVLTAVDRILEAIGQAREVAEALGLRDLAGFFKRSNDQYSELRSLVVNAVDDFEAKTKY
ncbi:MAG: hypothetical protein H3C38_02610 [Rhodospirillales bacterium]|nr:hypothetical protein [Rhodospirillales bacterium]